MSEDVFYTGRLRRVYQGDDLEGFAKSYVIDMGWEYHESQDSYLECFEDMSIDNNDTHIIDGDTIYEVVKRSSNNTYDDIFEASRNGDDTIDFTVKYYNGGCCFSEAIEIALKGLKDK